MSRRVACGLSHATKSTPDSISDEMKWTLRARRSSLAMTNVAWRNRQAASAAAICGRSFFLPEFDLLKLGDDDALGARDMARNRLALRLQAQPRGALLRGRHPVVGNKARLARRAVHARRGPARHFSAVSL